MKSLMIVTDSASDVELETAKQNNITIVPLTITIDGTNYVDGIEITKKEFYEKIAVSKEFPKTSQPTPALFLEAFKEAKKIGAEVLCITISSGLSGTYQSACLAKDLCDYDDIYIFDTLQGFAGERIFVDEAVRLKEQGLGAKEIFDNLTELKPRVNMLSMIDTLEYLYRGGRLSKAAMIVGEGLKLKVSVRINNDGVVEVYKKSLGKTRCFKNIFADLKAQAPDLNYPVYFSYCSIDDNLNELMEKCKENCPEILENAVKGQIGPVVGSHVGPGAFAIAYITQK